MSASKPDIKSVFRDNKKSIFFLARFLLVFGGASFLYGLWIKAYAPLVDPATKLVASHMQWLNGKDNLTLTPISLKETKQAALVFFYKGNYTIDLFEGCNGVAVVILFLAFIIAFKSTWKKTILFSLVGTVLIHIFNLGRLQLLMLLAAADKESVWYNMFDFMHKYLFTLVIYAFVFLLWVIWIKYFVLKPKVVSSPAAPEEVPAS